MGRRGPAPKPTALKLLTAPRGGRRKKSHEPQPAVGIPKMPSWLGNEAKTEWKRITPELVRLGLLTNIDATALAAYCEAFGDFVECTKQIKKEGRIIQRGIYDRKGQQTGTRPIAHPLILEKNAASARLKTYIIEFGLSPASRSRVKVTEGSVEANPIDELIRRGRIAAQRKSRRKSDKLDEPGPFATTTDNGAD